jgi:hypothetical protein
VRRSALSRSALADAAPRASFARARAYAGSDARVLRRPPTANADANADAERRRPRARALAPGTVLSHDASGVRHGRGFDEDPGVDTRIRHRGCLDDRLPLYGSPCFDGRCLDDGFHLPEARPTGWWSPPEAAGLTHHDPRCPGIHAGVTGVVPLRLSPMLAFGTHPKPGSATKTRPSTVASATRSRRGRARSGSRSDAFHNLEV